MIARIVAFFWGLFVVLASLIYGWFFLSSGWLIFWLPTPGELFGSGNDQNDTRNR